MHARRSSYVKTEDTNLAPEKTYHTESSGVYTKVTSPAANSHSDYYELVNAGAPINFMVKERSSVIKFDKRVTSRVLSPNKPENLNSYMMKERKYHIVELLDNKLDDMHISCTSLA